MRTLEDDVEFLEDLAKRVSSCYGFDGDGDQLKRIAGGLGGVVEKENEIVEQYVRRHNEDTYAKREIARYKKALIAICSAGEGAAVIARRALCLCEACGEGDTSVYMVLDAVWAESGMPPEGYLHLKCLEFALGRKLVRDDFTDAPCNIGLPEGAQHE